MDALGVYSGLSFPQLGIMQLVFAGAAAAGSGQDSARIDINKDWDIGTINIAFTTYTWPLGSVIYVLPTTGIMKVALYNDVTEISVNATSISFTSGYQFQTISCNLFKLAQ